MAGPKVIQKTNQGSSRGVNSEINGPGADFRGMKPGVQYDSDGKPHDHDRVYPWQTKQEKRPVDRKNAMTAKAPRTADEVGHPKARGRG